MLKPWSMGALALLLVCEYPSDAQAAHCPRGNIYRVSLKLCVGRLSHLALGFAHRPRPAARPARYDRHQARDEEPSHKGITYVTVVDPPPPPAAEIDIPYTLPPSRMNHQPVAHFDALQK